MQADRTEELVRLLRERVLVLDGAMGTMIQQYRLTEADFRGERLQDHPVELKGDNDLLVLTHPEVIGEIHRAYLEAGADVIETNTFNATRTSQADYGLAHLAYEINREAARLARTLADAYSTPDKPRFVAGVIGPTSKTLSLSPDVNDPGFRAIDFDTLAADYLESARALVEGGGRGSQLASSRGTAWGLLNGISEYVDHHRRARSDDHRRDAAWFGEGARIKQRAWEVVTELVA